MIRRNYFDKILTIGSIVNYCSVSQGSELTNSIQKYQIHSTYSIKSSAISNQTSINNHNVIHAFTMHLLFSVHMIIKTSDTVTFQKIRVKCQLVLICCVSPGLLISHFALIKSPRLVSVSIFSWIYSPVLPDYHNHNNLVFMFELNLETKRLLPSATS